MHIYMFLMEVIQIIYFYIKSTIMKFVVRNILIRYMMSIGLIQNITVNRTHLFKIYSIKLLIF